MNKCQILWTQSISSNADVLSIFLAFDDIDSTLLIASRDLHGFNPQGLVGAPTVA